MSALYIDENKSNGYIIAAAVVPADSAELRKALRALTKPGQRRLHFVSESDSRRREILSALQRLGMQTRVYQVKGLHEKEAREVCLTAMVADAAESGVRRIVLEQDEPAVCSDRIILWRKLGARGVRDDVVYAHEIAAAEPLLWIPDAVAWSVASGGD